MFIKVDTLPGVPLECFCIQNVCDKYYIQMAFSSRESAGYVL